MEELIDRIENWADNKQLLKKENSYPQFAKVVEEVAEIGTALNHKSKEELIDAIGDTFVTLVILAAQNDLKMQDCVMSAWNEIKNRTGKTENGVFKKD